jgi:hypothetical protein
MLLQCLRCKHFQYMPKHEVTSAVWRLAGCLPSWLLLKTAGGGVFVWVLSTLSYEVCYDGWGHMACNGMEVTLLMS